MTDRTDTATRPDDGTGAESGPDAVPPKLGSPRPVPQAAPAIGAFVNNGETRIRDLLAYAMAVEDGKIGTDGIEGLRRKAEADLQAHAFRVMHNQIEAIRREAADEERARAGRGLSFGGAVLANLIGLALAGGLAAAAAWFLTPGLFQRLVQAVAQLLARI